ncbi:unnamed protein product [Leuciscus chuanchicus]
MSWSPSQLHLAPDLLFQKDPVPTDEEEVVKGMNVGLLVVTEENTANLLPKEIIDVAVVLEEEIVLDGLKDVSNAFAVLMGLLYALDITYPEEVKYTFEVLQKVLMKIGGEACLRNKEQTVQCLVEEDFTLPYSHSLTF